jgi:hypothetical protein
MTAEEKAMMMLVSAYAGANHQLLAWSPVIDQEP